MCQMKGGQCAWLRIGCSQLCSGWVRPFCTMDIEEVHDGEEGGWASTTIGAVWGERGGGIEGGLTLQAFLNVS